MSENISENAKKDLKIIIDELFYNELTEKTNRLENKVKDIDKLNQSILLLKSSINDLKPYIKEELDVVSLAIQGG